MFTGLKNPTLRRDSPSLRRVFARRVKNRRRPDFVYDKKGQLTGVTDSNGTILESYKYDAAGNILEKVINGAAVKYTYDKANQLLTATMPDGIRKSYKYDAAGRLVEETAGTSSKSYSYGWSDKVTKVTDGKTESSFSYYPNGQLAKRSTDKTSENFYWDGLALLKRDNTNYLNEPYVTGGNPVLADDKLVFNDMLGTSIGSIEDGNFKYIPRTAFGETEDKSDVNFFTGKPDVAELGYNFMFRNYRADLGKWQTQDPLGYPDGWNNFAYCNNRTTSRFDTFGLVITCYSKDGSENSTLQTTLQNYFYKSDKGKKMWDSLQNDPLYKLSITENSGSKQSDFTNVSSSAGTIVWDPSMAGLVNNTGYISPELLLAHELGHAIDHHSDPSNFSNETTEQKEKTALAAEDIVAEETGEYVRSYEDYLKTTPTQKKE